jgi:hypothetical protein
MSAAVPIGVGLLAWALHQGPAALTAPARCPGALELAAVWTARLAPDAPLGQWLLSADAILFGAAVGLTTVLVQTRVATWSIAAAVGLTIAALPRLAPTYAPFDPALLLVAAATVFALTADARRAEDDRAAPGAAPTRLAVCAGLLATALIVPQAGVLLAVLAGVCARRANTPARRVRQALLAASAVAGAGLVIGLLIPGLPPRIPLARIPSCGLPLLLAPGAWAQEVGAILASAGPYALAVALVGAIFALTRAEQSAVSRTSIWALGAYALIPALDAAPTTAQAPRELYPLLIAFALLLGAGLSAMTRACGRRPAGRVAALFFCALLPVLQLAAPRSNARAADSFGVERLSAAAVNQLLKVLPDNSVLVDEDAIVPLLLRVNDDSRKRMDKRLALAPREPDTLSQLAASSRVRLFALPLAQSWLQWRSIAFRNANLPGVSGLAEALPGPGCDALTPDWQEVSSVTTARTSVLTIVGIAPGEDHVVLVYAITSAEAAPSPVDWPPAAQRGFAQTTYRLDHQGQPEALAVQLRKDAAAPGMSAAGWAFTTRLEVWRVSGAPSALPVTLGLGPARLFVRAGRVRGGEMICPAFPYRAVEVGVRR